MIDHTYLQKGLLATARSHQAGSMTGHLGANVLALSHHGQHLKQSGQNTIFAALALRALKD